MLRSLCPTSTWSYSGQQVLGYSEDSSQPSGHSVEPSGKEHEKGTWATSMNSPPAASQLLLGVSSTQNKVKRLTRQNPTSAIKTPPDASNERASFD